MLKLGTIIKDKTADIKGMLTIYSLDMGGNEHYLFQPAGLNPKDRQPLATYWINKNRVRGGEDIQCNLPVEILETEVEDVATGFKGTAVSLYLHLNGCIHVEVKTKGTIKETGETIKSHEFDVRRLKGKAIKKVSEAELAKSRKETPSPEEYESFSPQSMK